MRPRPLSLRTITALKGLPSDALRSIEDAVEWLEIAPGKPILDYRSDGHCVFFLLRGRASVLLFTSSGRIVELSTLTEGRMFGELAAIDGLPRSASVVAETTCVVARLSAAHFLRLVEEERLVLRALLEHLAAMIRTLTSRVLELSVLTVPARLQAELLRMALEGQISGDSAIVRNMPTHGELANRIATAREVVSRELGQLDRKGIIQRRGGTLTVPSVSRLDAMVRTALGDVEEITGRPAAQGAPAVEPARNSRPTVARKEPAPHTDKPPRKEAAQPARTGKRPRRPRG